MQAFVSKLMAVLVLAQAASGWCCHRPCHCLDGDVAEASLTTSDVCGHDECCHDDHETLVLNASSHCQCHECQGFCTYLAGAKSHLVRSQMELGFGFLATNSDVSHVQLSVERAAATSEPIHLGPPVRLHLLHQSLLI
jgi:hypothetical protein